MKRRVIEIFSWITFSSIILTVGIYLFMNHRIEPKIIGRDQTTDTMEVNSLLKEGYIYFYKPYRSIQDLDSSLLIIHKAYKTSKRVNFKKGIGKCLDAYSKIYGAKRDTLIGRLYADSSITVFKENNLFFELADAYYNRSGYCPLDSKLLKQRIEWVKLALITHRRSGSKLNQANLLKELGDLQQYDLNFSEALLSLQQSLAMYNLINYHQGNIGVYDLLGSVLSMQGNYRLSVKYGLLALKVSLEVADSSFNSLSSLTTVYNRIGVNYERMKRYQLALRYFDEGYRVAVRNKDVPKQIALNINRSKMLYFLGNTRQAVRDVLAIPKRELDNNWVVKGNVHALLLISYLKLKDYNRCRFYSQALLDDNAYAKKMGVSRVTITSALSRYYLAIGEMEKAEIYLKENELILREHNLLAELTESYKVWVQLDSAKGDLKRYIEHTKRYQVLHDSSLNERNNQEIAQMQIEFETEKKDKDIVLKTERIKLLNAENKIQVSNLKQAMLVRNVTIGGVILLIIIVILLYNRYQFKNRINQTISQKNTDLNQLVTEKEWLLKEIHHRVKNNLQIIISLLDSQSMYLNDNAALSAIRDSQTRVHCMSLIHKKLYQNDNISTINMSLYIHELVEYLVNAFGIDRDIRFELDIAEVQLNISQSIPIGLILNEAITNSIKYAFRDKMDGKKIDIHLSVISNQCQLIIHDNGVGLPYEFDQENVSSLGMNLMKGLSEDIDATFSITNKNGTCIEIGFHMHPHIPLLLPNGLLPLTSVS